MVSIAGRATCPASLVVVRGVVRQQRTCSRSLVAGRQFDGRRSSSPKQTVRSASGFRVLASVVTDPKTKLTFPETVDGLKCLGAGTREKKVAFINVNVYSVALYVDSDGASAALKGGNDLLSGDFERMLTIKLARKVDGPTFWGALNEAVMPRIAQIATDQATAEDEDGNFMAEVAEAAEVKEEEARDAAEELGEWIQGQALDNGTEVSLRWASGGVLRASVGGGEETTYTSNELCQAIFDVYLGEDPISPSALQAFQSGAASL